MFNYLCDYKTEFPQTEIFVYVVTVGLIDIKLVNCFRIYIFNKIFVHLIIYHDNDINVFVKFRDIVGA